MKCKITDLECSECTPACGNREKANRYAVVVENVLNAYILDKKDNTIVAICSTKRPDLGFAKLKELVQQANEKLDIDNLADYLIENASEAFEHQDRKLLENALKRYFEQPKRS